MRNFWIGVLAGLGFVAAELLARLLFGIPTLAELAQDRVVALLPGPLFSFLLDRLLYLGKPALFAGLLLSQLVLAGLGGLAAGRWRRPFGLAGALWLVTGLVVLPLAGRGPFAGSLRVAAAALAAFAAYGWGLAAWGREPAYEPDRRRLIAGAALFLGAAWMARRAVGKLPSLRPAGPSASPAQPPLPAEVTPTDAFYVVSKNLADPVIGAGEWHLQVGGLVERPLTLGYQDVLALPAAKDYRTLECISNRVGGDLISNGLWTGVPLRELLLRAGVRSGATDVHFVCADGYTENMPLAKALDPATLLAYQLNGSPLSPRHGFPLRVLGTGTYGMKNPKWLTRLEVVTRPAAGFWEQQGWDSRAIVKTMSRIDTPSNGSLLALGPVRVAGVAFAGDRGIRAAEVSTDGGNSWQQAELLPSLGRFTWVVWTYVWQPLRPGVYTLAVRATDGFGNLQEARESDAFPSGASGYHRVRVVVAG